MRNNSNQDLVNMNADIKLGEILSVCFQEQEQNFVRTSDISQGP